MSGGMEVLWSISLSGGNASQQRKEFFTSTFM